MTTSFMRTANGNEFDLRAPRAGTIVTADIAHHLAQINRFCGACCRPYSVAEHSLLVCEIVQRLFSSDLHAQFAALMHDAHEAYVGDLASPAKHLVGEAWGHLEIRATIAVRGAYALATKSWEHRDIIKAADLIARATEREQLLPPGGTPWPELIHIEPVRWVDLMAPERVAMTWTDWRQAFADQADALDHARNADLFPVHQP
jgi:hypothetical protein